ncbi:pentatricopeptide repeat-containing protein At3g58590 isoform X2 [Malania oleifera]|uniref:pentatricopeptide repeat-containing protein At3g58590 isoform X2 n=1 Tax=Malania oleifera TaxID=397392 RepID=UPI0025ADF658|nr:pentatricopeptide repeat-containing protein At3g58590 isoform X2 [Malania oleifera]
MFTVRRARASAQLSQLHFPFSVTTRKHSDHVIFRHFFHGSFFSHQCYFMELLQACTKVGSLDATKSLHALTITMGSKSDQSMFFHNNIINLYMLLDEYTAAHNVFNEMTQRNIVSYNTIISGYSRCGNVEGAWSLFSELKGCELRPNQFTFGGLLSCESLDMCSGIQLHALIIKNGLLYSNAFSGTALLCLFGRCGYLHEAIQTFDEMPQKNVVTWNSLISLLGHFGLVEECVLLFRELTRTEIILSECSFLGVLLGFVREQDLESGSQIHGTVIKHGLDYKVTVVNSLINMYVKCSCIYLAEKLFEGTPIEDVVSWNVMIGALAKTERAGKALELFLKMPWGGILPNQTTFVSAINSCAHLQIPIYGQLIHAKVIRNRYEFDVFVGSALVDFYAKCDKIEDAHRCFDEIYEKNVVSWNALIFGYSTQCSSTSVSLLQEMIRLGYQPTVFSFSAVLKSSSVLELQQLHSFVLRAGHDKNEYVLSSLIASYAKNNLLLDALTFVTEFDELLPVVPSNIIAGIYNRSGQYNQTQDLFSLLQEPDIVSWNILIAACARNGDCQEVFELFKQMQRDQEPDGYTFVSLLNASTKLCNLVLGSSIHGIIIKTGLMHYDTFVGNLLVDMYGKCGSIGSSLKAFDDMVHRNLITWTALISALGLNGRALEALERFKEMALLGFEPDGVAFITMLSACRHGGLVKEGMELFMQMKSNYGIEPQMDHYHCAVDLLTRYGHVKQAQQLIASMPFPPNALIWRSFLEGWKRQRFVDDQARECMYLDMD